VELNSSSPGIQNMGIRRQAPTSSIILLGLFMVAMSIMIFGKNHKVITAT